MGGTISSATFHRAGSPGPVTRLRKTGRRLAHGILAEVKINLLRGSEDDKSGDDDEGKDAR